MSERFRRCPRGYPQAMRQPDFNTSQELEDAFGEAKMRRYVHPYYLDLMGYGALRANCDLLDEVRQRSSELDEREIAMLLGMHWRPRVMGAWYAVAANNGALATAIHESLETSLGHLTSPALIVAALRHPTAGTRALLDDYRREDEARHWNVAGFAKAAAARLVASLGQEPVGQETDDAVALDAMMNVAVRLARH